MPIVARDLDVSERKVVFSEQLAANTLINGATIPAFVMPFPFEVVAVASAITGSTGTINVVLQNYRFIPGSGGGATMFGAMNSSFAISALGTSGINSVMAGNVVGWSLPVAGSTLLQGVAGDVLTLVGIGSGAVNANSTYSVVVKKLQDIASHFGAST